jgi:hypothetical protein
VAVGCTLAGRPRAECPRRLLLARSDRIVLRHTAQHAQDLDPETDSRSAARALPRHRPQEGARHSTRPLPRRECTCPTESCAGADSSPLLEVRSSHQQTNEVAVWMIRNSYLGCQYRDLRTNFQRGWIEHSSLVRQRADVAAENLAIRCTLHVGATATDRVGNTLCLCGRGRTTMFHS